MTELSCRGASPIRPASWRRAALLLLLASAPGWAQFQIPGMGAASPARAEAAPDPRAQTPAQLEAVRAQQVSRARELAGAAKHGVLAATERQGLLDRLVAAYGERLKLLDDQQALAKPHPDASRLHELIGEFAGPPPYPVLRVDTLREEADALDEHMQRMRSEEKALEVQKVILAAARDHAAEALRLAEDTLARSAGEAEVAREHLHRETAELRLKIAEASLVNNAIRFDAVGLAEKRQQALREELGLAIDRVLPAQQLTKDELEDRQAWLRTKLAVVNAEIDRLMALATQHSAERDALAVRLAARGSRPADLQRQKVLDVLIETDRVVLMTLSWQPILLQMSSDSWAQRYAGLRLSDAAGRNAVISALKQTQADLDSRRSALKELKYGARTAVQEQELRLGNGQLDAATMSVDREILDSLRQRVEIYERLELSGIRLDRNLDRGLTDLGVSGAPATPDDWRLMAQQLGDGLKRLWRYELFSVDDATVVDGRSILVSYGVTVGKGVGVVLLFALGYLLLAWLSRLLQRLMVRRFQVAEQLAVVIRRWIMIALVMLLAIFILNIARIPLTVFAFMGGALVIGVGIGTQTIIRNVVSGMILLFERKIRVGDIVAINGVTGHVTTVDLRASTITGFDGVEALIPNSILLENQVLNWTYSSPRIRREVRVGIKYGAPVHEAAEILRRCAGEHGQVLNNPPPEVFFEDFGDSALQLSLVFWVELGSGVLPRRVESDLRYALEKHLAAAGIGIPFPQREVHLVPAPGDPVRTAVGVAEV